MTRSNVSMGYHPLQITLTQQTQTTNNYIHSQFRPSETEIKGFLDKMKSRASIGHSVAFPSVGTNLFVFLRPRRDVVKAVNFINILLPR